MRESCTYGSARGARDNSRPYRTCPPAFGRPWRMKTVSPWPISGFWPNTRARDHPMASCFLYKRREFIALLGGAAAGITSDRVGP
jgi:hypothetical protein